MEFDTGNEPTALAAGFVAMITDTAPDGSAFGSEWMIATND